MEIERAKVPHFDHVGQGLVSEDGKPLTWFAVAGEDGKSYPASAETSKDAIVVNSPQVPKPVNVRFAWERKQSITPLRRMGFRRCRSSGNLSRIKETA